MEAASNASFSNYTNRVGFDLFDYTDAGTQYTYAQKLTGAANAQVGLTKSFKVYAGDKVKIEAYAKYWNASSTPSNLSGFALALTNAFGVTAGSTGEALKAYNTLTSYGSLVAGGGGHSNNSTDPIVGVTILLFDKDFKLIDATWKQLNVNSVQVGATPKAPHEYLSSEYVVREAGYAYMYVSNDSPTLVEAYFDDVVMTYTPGNIVQYNEYYPFGLQTATSWTRENSTGNNFLYNGGTELNATTGVYDLHYRTYDPVLGRMNQVDPVASKYGSVTPYNYAFNSPVVMNDPLGDESTTGGKAYCSWCYTKSRPVDTGSGGGGGGYQGGGFVTNPGFSADAWAKIGGTVNSLWNTAGASADGRADWTNGGSDYSNVSFLMAHEGAVYSIMANLYQGAVIGLFANQSKINGAQISEVVKLMAITGNDDQGLDFFSSEYDETDLHHTSQLLRKIAGGLLAVSLPLEKGFENVSRYGRPLPGWLTTNIRFEKALFGKSIVYQPLGAMNAANAGKWATGLKIASKVAGIAGGGLALYDIGKNGLTTSNGLDLVMSGLAVSGFGTGIAAGYFILNAASILITNKDLGQHIDTMSANLTGKSVTSYINGN
jgi:RHS repeat-associated protein